MKLVIICALLIIIGEIVFSQTNDTIILKEIVINSSRTEISEKQMLRPIQIIDKKSLFISNDNDISSALKDLSAVDIRQRSFSSVQSDISTRGGSFDQTLVLLNGINLSDPQTGHYNLNIPIGLSNLDNIEVLYGPASRTFGTNALTGAVNFISRIPEKNALNFDISYGSFNTINADLGIDNVIRKFKQSFSLSYSKSDGFMKNTDYSRTNIYYENNFSIGKAKAKTMIGLLDKKSGAFSFYTPMYVNQFEKVRTGFAAFKLSGGTGFKWDYKIYYRALANEFQLFRESQEYYSQVENIWINFNTGDTVSWYQRHNNHLTNIAGTGFNIEKNWKYGKSAIGSEYRYEQIYSSVLGNDVEPIQNGLYNKSDDRKNLSVFAEHGYYSDKFLFNAGVMLYHNQKYGLNYYYGGDVGFYFNEKLMIKAGVNKSMRLPTFTELYYNGPSNIGNADLIPEQALSIEAGAKYYISKNSFVNINLFNRYGTNIISWVREENSNIWETKNLTELNVAGIEVFAAYRDFKKDFFKSVSIVYSYIYQDKYAEGLESKYTLDQLKHKFVLNLSHKIYKNLSAEWTLNMFKRNGEYLLYDFEQNAYTDMVSFPLTALVNLKVIADFNKFDIFLSGNNLTNQSYFDIANVPAPGIAVMGGVKIKL
ncbi:MAG: TonB-dependent receptor [Bacteroidales bacterium]|nr:TonB-dependent receptor [Bacteroidales bacterium]